MGVGFAPPPALDGRCLSSHTLTSPSSGGIGPRAQLEEPIPTATFNSVITRNLRLAQAQNDGAREVALARHFPDITFLGAPISILPLCALA